MTIPADGVAEAVPFDGIVLGTDPDTGAAVTRRMGRFGPYVQLGEATEDGEKPRRASIPKGKDAATVTFEEAMKYLSLPREVGLHPETKTPIVANFGRFGPFILHDGVYANLKDPDDVYTVGLNRAVDLLAEKRARGPSNRARPGAIKSLGAHPNGGGNIDIMGGRYGAYVKFGKINATLPKDKTPESLTLEEAVALIAERAVETGAKLKPVKVAKKAAKKPAAKKGAKKAAKKTATAA
jgi:DNA topoisomerase-1